MGREWKSITLTPWIFEQMWGDVLDGNINKLVLLDLSIDTFELKDVLKYSTKDVECKTEIL